MSIVVRKSELNGTIAVPGSKSHTVRAIAVALMASGTSKILNPLISGDTFSALKAAELLGAGIEKKPDELLIDGTGGNFSRPDGIVDMGNSGTSLRIFTALAATGDFNIVFDGDESLRSRPMENLLQPLRKAGVELKSNKGKCPVEIRGPFMGGELLVNGISSQFLTAVLFAAFKARNDTNIKVENLHEIPYVEITLDWLKEQKMDFSYSDDYTQFEIPAGQNYKSFERTVQADFSTACFPLVAATVTQGEIKLENLDFSDPQGDKEVFKFFEQMGTDIKMDNKSLTVAMNARLEAGDFDLNATPDALPAMAVAAAFADGKTRLLNVPQARIKETDRISCMSTELNKMGIETEELEDGLIVYGGKPKAAVLNGYNDHRIAMALAVAGFAIDGETVIEN